MQSAQLIRSASRMSVCGFYTLFVGACLTLAAPAVAPQGALAQQMQVQRIAAVVNDDAITIRDVDERMDLLIGTSNLPDTDDTRRRLLPRVLQILIEERLKQQEAKRLGISVTEADMVSARRQIEDNNRIPAGSLEQHMRSKGVDMAAMDSQLRADMAWVKVVQSSLRRQVFVESEEIEAVLSTLRENLGKPQRLLAEIVIPVNDPSEETQAREMADRLIEQLKQGAPFQALARQFSGSSTAAVGGDLGWIPEGQLDPELEDAVAGLNPGELSRPVMDGTGVHLLLLRDIRQTKRLEPNETPVTLSQLFFPNGGPAAMPETSRDDIIATLAETAKSCADVDRMAEQIRLPSSGAIGTHKPADLPPAVRDVAATLKENTLSSAVTLPNGTAVLMVCERKDADGLPSRDQIEQRLETDKLERLAQRTLRDLRRRALIDIRI